MLEPTAKDDRLLGNLVRFNKLLDAYGDLLTERQRRLARMHFEQDMSFAEIAREEGVSRQAIHDAVKHAALTLEKLDRHLGLTATEGAEPLSPAAINEAMGALRELRDRLQRSSGVIYSSDWIVKSVVRALDILGEGRDGAGAARERDQRQG